MAEKKVLPSLAVRTTRKDMFAESVAELYDSIPEARRKDFAFLADAPALEKWFDALPGELIARDDLPVSFFALDSSASAAKSEVIRGLFSGLMATAVHANGTSTWTLPPAYGGGGPMRCRQEEYVRQVTLFLKDCGMTQSVYGKAVALAAKHRETTGRLKFSRPEGVSAAEFVSQPQSMRRRIVLASCWLAGSGTEFPDESSEIRAMIARARAHAYIIFGWQENKQQSRSSLDSFYLVARQILDRGQKAYWTGNGWSLVFEEYCSPSEYQRLSAAVYRSMGVKPGSLTEAVLREYSAAVVSTGVLQRYASYRMDQLEQLKQQSKVRHEAMTAAIEKVKDDSRPAGRLTEKEEELLRELLEKKKAKDAKKAAVVKNVVSVSD